MRTVEHVDPAFPIGELHPHPNNARQGDVGAIVESLRAHGQYRPIVANRRTADRGWDMDDARPVVVAGNHTLAAARHLGWDTIDVAFIDVDAEQERRILLVDNRTNDLATYDDHGLADLLTDLANNTADGLTGTGFDMGDLDDLLKDLTANPFGEFDKDDRYTPAWIFDAIGITFDLDPAGPPGGSNVPCHRYYTEADDGLTAPWEGTVWLNPPFSNATDWARRFIDHGDGFFLGPTSKARWTAEMFRAVDGVWIPDVPFNFETPHPDLTASIDYLVFIAAVGPQSDALNNLADKGPILRATR